MSSTDHHPATILIFLSSLILVLAGCERDLGSKPHEGTSATAMPATMPRIVSTARPEATSALTSTSMAKLPPGQVEEPFDTIVACLEGLETAAISVSCLSSKPGVWEPTCDLDSNPLLAVKVREFAGMMKIASTARRYSQRVRNEIRLEVGIAATGLADGLGVIPGSPRWRRMQEELLLLAERHEAPLDPSLSLNAQLACLRGLILIDQVDSRVEQVLVGQPRDFVERTKTLRCNAVSQIGPEYRGALVRMWVRFQVPPHATKRTMDSLREVAPHAVARLEGIQ